MILLEILGKRLPSPEETNLSLMITDACLEQHAVIERLIKKSKKTHLPQYKKKFSTKKEIKW